MAPRGGTEILWSGFKKWIDRNLYSKVNIILSDCNPALLSSSLPNILWQHVDTDQGVARGMGDPDYVSKLDRIVFVSNWQMNKWIDTFNLPPHKCTVLLNAIEPVDFVEKISTGPLRLIYTSTPWRGLEILVEAHKLLNRHDVVLDVYSSTVIYGANFMPNAYSWLFDRCRLTRGINYRGYAANKAVIKACGSAHIFAYPSVFAETSCLAAIEAGAAGCKIVTTDLGALPETCGRFASYTSQNTSGLIERYAALLNTEIDNYWNNYPTVVEQSKYFNERYSWTNRKTEWENLIKTVL